MQPALAVLGDARVIRRIDFFYRAVGGVFAAQSDQPKTTVHLYGRR